MKMKTMTNQRKKGTRKFPQKAGVIGLGYVGLPLTVEIAKATIPVIGFEVDQSKVDSINQGVSYIDDVPSGKFQDYVKSGLMQATTDFSLLRTVDAISICVPTPLRKTKDPDISYIIAAIENIRPHLHKGQLIILESTTYPGTTDELLLEEFEKCGLKVGKDFYLSFSPERVDPGNSKWKTKNTPKIVGGVTPECTQKTAEYYSQIFDTVIPVSSARCAEMVKLLENTFRSVNIGLVNEVAIMCDRLGLDVWEVINAAASKPFGFMPFYPGPGIGGHCIPLDPHYLAWKLKTLDYHARFIELASQINGSMPEYVVLKVTSALNDDKKAVNGSNILILGVTYKPNVSDVRESPALDIIRLLDRKGATIYFSDPYVDSLIVSETEHDHLHKTPLTAVSLKKMDCVIIVTNHSVFDYDFVCKNTKLIMDTRNATKNVKHPVARIVKI